MSRFLYPLGRDGSKAAKTERRRPLKSWIVRRSPREKEKERERIDSRSRRHVDHPRSGVEKEEGKEEKDDTERRKQEEVRDGLNNDSVGT